MKFGSALGLLRKDKRLSRAKLAEKLGVSESTIRNREWERANLTEETLRTHLEGLGSTLGELADVCEGNQDDKSTASQDALVAALAAMHEKNKLLESRLETSAVDAEDLSLADEVLGAILTEFGQNPDVQDRVRRALLRTSWRQRAGMTSGEVSKVVHSILLERSTRDGTRGNST